MRDVRKCKEVHKNTYLVITTCDICGDQTEGHNWAKGGFDRQFISVKNSVGTDFYGDRSGTTYNYDICPGCFIDKLEPFLQSLGAKPSEIDWNEGTKYREGLNND